MIKATRVGNTLICVIGQKMYQKTVDSDTELMAIYEQALNTDENDSAERSRRAKRIDAMAR
jgi:hypothetical protein